MTDGILLVMGELSADLYAARLVGRLRPLLPGVAVRALGGEAMRAAGAELVFPLAARGLMGLSEAAAGIGFLRQALAALRAELRQHPPRVAVLMDFGGFNLRAAAVIRQLSPRTRVLYWIPPKVWVWGGWRTRTLRRVVHRVLSIFPFEHEFLTARGVKSEFVGHPLPELLRAEPDSPGFAEKYNLRADRPLLLLPGSRPSEWKRLLPLLLDAAQLFSRREPCAVWLAPAPNLPRAWLAQQLRRHPVPVQVIDERYAAMRRARVALAASGTVTLELMLHGLPTVIAYRMAPVTYLLARCLARVDFAGLPNLLAGREVMPELLQGKCTAANLAAAAAELWGGERQRQVRADCAALAEKLGGNDGIRRAAESIARDYREQV